VRSRLLLSFTVVALLAGCALDAPSGPDTPVSDDPGTSPVPGAPRQDGTLTIGEPVDGPALQVADALGADAPVRVSGSLFVDADGAVLLCGAIAESFPPQCAGERLAVVGLDLDDVPGLQEANGVRWAEQIELSGVVS
jgi:hypothetical protein